MHFEELLVERRKKDKAVKKYIEDFLESPLSEAIAQCFHDAEHLSYSRENLKNFRRFIIEMGGHLNVLWLDKPVKILRQDASFAIERLLKNKVLSDMQKKLRLHALIFLIRHLEKETGGYIRAVKMPPELVKIAPVREVNKRAASFDEVQEIFKAAESINIRDCLILKLIFESEKSMQDVLKIKCKDVNYKDRVISGIRNIITSSLMTSLKEYVQSTAVLRDDCPHLFVSNQGKQLCRTQPQKTLDKANLKVELPYRITTKMLQRSQRSERLERET